jgi:hypothetical protein
LLTQVIQTPEQQHYLSKLLGFHYEIQYKPRVTNVVVVALSHSVEPEIASLGVLSVPQFLFLDELKQELVVDPTFQSLLQRYTDDPVHMPDYKVVDGLPLYKGRIWVSPQSRFKQLLLKEFHDSLVGGHVGVVRTLKRLCANFYWDNMRQEVQTYVCQCSLCQMTKYDTKRPNSLLQPLHVPSKVWKDVSMDFVTGLPPSSGDTVLLVVVDRFSKGVHLGALPTRFITYNVTDIFISKVCKHHGIPRSIVAHEFFLPSLNRRSNRGNESYD